MGDTNCDSSSIRIKGTIFIFCKNKYKYCRSKNCRRATKKNCKFNFIYRYSNFRCKAFREIPFKHTVRFWPSLTFCKYWSFKFNEGYFFSYFISFSDVSSKLEASFICNFYDSSCRGICKKFRETSWKSHNASK